MLAPVVAVVGTAAPAATGAADAPAPAVVQATRAYGDGPVRLAPGQGVDVRFRARRGDRVMLDVRSADSYDTECFGTQTLVDRRGRRTAVIDHTKGRLVTVRATGPTTLSFRGHCAPNEWQTGDPVTVQLTKIRVRRVGAEERVRVRAPRRGRLDMALVRVSRRHRDTLFLRNADGTPQYSPRSLMMTGGRRLFSSSAKHGISVEAGYRSALRPIGPQRGSKLVAGTTVGLVAVADGHAEVLRAREHRVAPDHPPLTLTSERGREHVLIYGPSRQADRLHLQVLERVSRDWSTYELGRDQHDRSLLKTVVTSDADAPQQTIVVRMRRTVTMPDLVVDGPPVTFASAEPGTWFTATIPASTAGRVRLTASDVATTGAGDIAMFGAWSARVPSVAPCVRDCFETGLSVGPDRLVADGTLYPGEPHRVGFYYYGSASGSVTLALTDIP